MHMRHMAENNTQPMVGTSTANKIPRPTQKARKPISLFFLKILKVLPSQRLLIQHTIYKKKQLYSKYPITARAAATMKYHRAAGINLDIRNIDRIMHKPPAYLLYVYLITDHPCIKIKPYII